MDPLSQTSLLDWQAERQKIPEFIAAGNELEPGFQIARLHSSIPSLSLLKRIANALGANIEVRLIPKDIEH